MGVGAGNADLAALDRLAQRIEDGALEFGQLVEEQDAEMREADLAGADAQPAAGHRRHAGRMVGGAEGPLARDPSALQGARDRGDHRYLQRFGRSEVGQDAGQAGRQQRFARAGRADHQHVVAI